MNDCSHCAPYITLDPRVGHRGIGGFGYCIDCGATGPGMCEPKRQAHPRIWAQEARRLEAVAR